MEWCTGAAVVLLVGWWLWTFVKRLSDQTALRDRIATAATELERQAERTLEERREEAAAQSEEDRLASRAWQLAFPEKSQEARDDYEERMAEFLDGRELGDLPTEEREEYWALSSSIEDSRSRLRRAWWRKLSPAKRQRWACRVAEDDAEYERDKLERYATQRHENAVRYAPDFPADITVDLLEEAAEELEALRRAEEGRSFSLPTSTYLLHIWVNRSKPDVLEALRAADWETLGSLLPQTPRWEKERDERHARWEREQEFKELLREELQKGRWSLPERELILREVERRRSQRTTTTRASERAATRLPPDSASLPEIEAVRICPSCETHNDANAKFCKRCGTRVEGIATDR